MEDKKINEFEEAKAEEGDWKEATGDGGGFWFPEKDGETLVGELKAIKEGKYGDIYDVYISETKKIMTVPTSKYLQMRIHKDNIGMEIKILFEGWGEAEGGKNAPRKFKVWFK